MAAGHPTVSKHLACLPNPGAYARAWRSIAAMEPAALVSTSNWKRPVAPAGQLRDEMRRALDRRINTRGGMPSANTEIPVGLVRDARRLEQMRLQRVRIHQFESELCRRRFGHLLARHDD